MHSPVLSKSKCLALTIINNNQLKSGFQISWSYTLLLSRSSFEKSCVSKAFFLEKLNKHILTIQQKIFFNTERFLHAFILCQQRSDSNAVRCATLSSTFWRCSKPKVFL